MPDPETPVPRDGRFLVDGQPHVAFMNITVNGEITVCSEGATLLDLILRLGLSPEKIVVERNRDIVPAGTFAETALQDGDSLELLQFVGGG